MVSLSLRSFKIRDMRNYLPFAQVIVVSVLIILIAFPALSKNIKTSEQGTSQLQVVSVSDLSLKMICKTGQVKMDVIGLTEGDYAQLSVAASSHSTTIGHPDLPVTRKLIEIPFGADPVITIKGYEVKEYKLADYGISFPVMPVQPPQPKCGDSPDFVCNTNLYKHDAYLPAQRVSVEVLGIMRGVRIARVSINPVEYNPVQNTIRVYENIDFEITYDNADPVTTAFQKEKYFSPYFKGLFHKLVNFQPDASRENLTQYPIKYVVVSDPMFETDLQPFIEWKKQKGFMVEEAYTDVIGDSKEEIKAYLKDLYDNASDENPAPSFVLFVGDINQMPTWNNGDGVTDRNYVEYTDDLFPEIFYGRFSAETSEQLQPYIDKTLQYEQYTMPDPSYLEEVVLVAGMDGSHGHDWGNGQINYGTINYFNEDHDILSHTYLYPESGANAASIRQDVSNGATFVNYSAHCGPSGWSDPSFTISDIPALSNQDKYGLIIGNCCSSSEYQTTCFAEEILRAANKGAVGYIGGSNSTYWDEDYYFGVGVGEISEDPPSYEETTLGNYDRSFHENDEPFGDWYVTMDQVLFAGNLAVSESGSSLETYYWDIYNLMGDPSLMIYYGIPDEMTVEHDPMIIIGTTSFDVATEPYAYIALNMEGENVAVALADESGNATLEFTSPDTPGTAELVITAQNFQPYINDIMVLAPDGAYCMYQAHAINDSLGNDNNLAEYKEELLVSVTLENFGNIDAEEVEVTITTTNPYVTILDDNEAFGTIPANSQVAVENGFKIKLAETIPDQMEIIFDVMAVDSQDSIWYSDFALTANAPELNAGTFTIVEDQNGNGRLDPGETATIRLETMNTGHCAAEDVVASFKAYNPYITVLTEDISFEQINSTEFVYPEFEIAVSEDAPDGSFAEMRYFLNSGNIDMTKTYYTKVGMLLEDWETAGFEKFNWQMGGETGWLINDAQPFEGFYDAKSAPIDDEKSTEFSIHYELISDDSIVFYRKVSSEPDYDFLYFMIDGNEKGKWSGTVNWERMAYAVSAGQHTFTWKYEKDYSMTGGDDCAWVDYIMLPTMMATTIYAGHDDVACTNLDSYYCSGTATNYDSIFWLSSGTGSFSYDNVFDPQYFWSEEDALNGEVTLTLNIVDVDGNTVSDEMMLSFGFSPSQADLPSGPELVDIGETSESQYTTQEIDGVDGYIWSIYPVEAGTINGETTTATVLWNEDFLGDAWVKVYATNNCGDGPVSDSLKVVVTNAVGIAPAELVMTFEVMPNPNHGQFKLVVNSPDSEEFSIQILNQVGQVVYDQKAVAIDRVYQANITTGQVQPGIYFLVIQNKTEKLIKKLLVNP